MRRFLGMVIIIVSLAVLIRAAGSGWLRTFSDADALDIAETTFRYQFENNASGAQQKANAYFLSLLGKDPSPEFLKRFEGHKPPVRKGSEFVTGTGTEFTIDRIKRLSRWRAEVSGGYYRGPLSASGCTYTVELRGWRRKWVVTGCNMDWIS